MNWAPWESATKCSGGPTRGAQALWQWLDASYPGMFTFGGIYNCRVVRGGTARSIHAEGRAVDAMLRPVGGKGDPRGHDVVARLGAVGRAAEIQCAIFDRRIWTAKSPSGREYRGVAPHYDHIHIELTRKGSGLSLADFDRLLGPSGAQDRRRLLRLTSPMMRGDDVVLAQQKLGVTPADGVFGSRTREAVVKFQKDNGLNADGIVGPATWSRLLGA